MKRLNFTTKVLGKEGAERLREGLVTQTIRGINSKCVVGRWQQGDSLVIYLDDKLVGYTKALELEPTRWIDLTNDDAVAGGFDDRIDLQQALKRAGYRFHALEAYKLYRLNFSRITNGN